MKTLSEQGSTECLTRTAEKAAQYPLPHIHKILKAQYDRLAQLDPSKVERARRLLADPNWPSPAHLDELARRLTSPI